MFFILGLDPTVASSVELPMAKMGISTYRTATELGSEFVRLDCGFAVNGQDIVGLSQEATGKQTGLRITVCLLVSSPYCQGVCVEGWNIPCVSPVPGAAPGMLSQLHRLVGGE